MSVLWTNRKGRTKRQRLLTEGLMKPRWGLEGCSTSQGMAGAPEAGRGGRDPALEPLEGVGFGVHLDFWFSPSKLGGNKFLLFLVVLFVAAGYAAVPQGYTQCSAPHGNVSSPCLSPFWTPLGAHVFDVILWLHSDFSYREGKFSLIEATQLCQTGEALALTGFSSCIGSGFHLFSAKNLPWLEEMYCD